MSSPEKLLAIARAARENAYAPYSSFLVGAALETADGTIVTGVNVENASYGLSICAERSAFVRAVSEGHRAFKQIAVAGPDGVLTSPCGACRQFMAEFDPGLPVTFSGTEGAVQTTLDALLPYSFGPNSLV